MNSLEFSLLVWLGSLAAGFLGSLTGLGGGVVIVPLLALRFGVDIHYAVGASLVSIIATLGPATESAEMIGLAMISTVPWGAAYVKEGYANLRIGMFLEIATTIGALAGASLAIWMPHSAIAVIFGIVLFFSAYQSNRPRPEHPSAARPDPLATFLRMDSTYPTTEGLQPYRVHNVPGGFGLMFVAGALSGLLGIGSGAVKVLAMDQVMRIPFKVSTTTSNFMIGVTAAASAGVYLSRGYIDPVLAMPVMLGALAGSMLGAKVLIRAKWRSEWNSFTKV